MKIYWLAGKNTQSDEDTERNGHNNQWEFAGIFDSELKAINACVDKAYFIAPFLMNNELPHKLCKMHGSYYPLLQDNYEDFEKTKAFTVEQLQNPELK